MSRAAKQGVDKGNFVIDIGDGPLTANLESQLSAFNEGRRQQLNELWIMSQEHLHQVNLM